MSVEYMLVTKRKKLTILLAILLILLIIFPIFFNIFIVYKRTLNVVKKEKIDSMEQLINKTYESLHLIIRDIETSIAKFASSVALRKALQEYYKIKPYQQHSIDIYIEKKLNNILKNNVYFSKVVCITEKGKIYTDGINEIDIKDFKSSQVHLELESIENKILWGFDLTGSKLNSNEGNNFYIIHKIKSVDNDKNLGYIIGYIDIEKFKDKYQNIKIADSGEIYILNKELLPIISEPKYKIPEEYLKSYLYENEKLSIKSLKINDKEFIMGLVPIKELDSYMIGIVPEEELYYTTKIALKKNNIILSIIGISVIILILIIVHFISKIAMENTMTKYRLRLTEEMNERLRMYKHDFMNHLQIIQGLLELNKPDRAYKYLSNVAEEGKQIKQNFKIGIPELEAAIFTTINEASEYNIDVKIDSMELPEELQVNLYDLIKILVNLIKNAIEALKKSNSNYKELVIKISNELDELVFEVSNNVPLIPQEVREKVFEKDFSTDDNKEKGLGLYIVKQLVKKNNGRIELKVDEKGNHFIVYFPL